MWTLTWDEPDGCTTERGWCHLAEHPDRERLGDNTHDCVGNYLAYFDPKEPHRQWGSRGPAGETVHAVAYLMTCRGSVYTQSLGHSWWFTVADAKAWIERAVRLHLDTVAEMVA